MLTPEEIAEIERPVPGSGALWKLNEQKEQLLAEVKRLRAEAGSTDSDLVDADADATTWHDTYQNEVNARDEFFGELLKLLPGAEDEGMDAYDQIPRAIEALRTRLKAAEDTCVMLGWSAARHEGDREKATHELWSRWANIVGSAFLAREAHPDLSREEIIRLAAQRDETRARTLARIRSEAPTELPGGEG
jgi:enamine deaminase RidA (YjgF/YER057c/UK114 family)